MASGPITSWEIDGETVETVSDFILLASKITADGDCSHEIKRCLLLGRRIMTNLDSILNSRDITLSTRVCLVKAIIFHFHALDKEMAAHSSVLAWRIPGTGEPGGLPSLGSHRVGHDWGDLAAAASFTYVFHSHIWSACVSIWPNWYEVKWK